ncbi:MAG: pyridoxal 5'-phosphate synthase glutaminase subunit PdxT [Acidimicrobiales bacterium]
MEIGVLALQGDVAEHGAALAELAVDTRPVRRPEDLAGLDGIVLPGGESTTMSMLLESSGLAEPLGKELAAGIPAFGTCAGMILLAASVVDGRPDQRSFGAIDITVRRNGFGRQLDSFECDLQVRGITGGALHAVFIRAPMVEAVGRDVEVLASLAPLPAHRDAPPPGAGAPAPTPVLCRQGAVLVSAFHPELTSDRRLHRLFVSMIEEKGR